MLRYALLSALAATPLLSFAAQRDTIKVYFDIGVPTPDDAGIRKLDSLVYSEVIVPGKKFGIIGYADYLGNDTANIKLSEERAKNVQTYLEQMGCRKEDIQVVIGKGEVKRDTENGSMGYREDRRVDIIPGGFPQSKPVKAVTAKPQPKPKPAEVLPDISQLKKNETLRLDNIYFLPGSHIMKEESMPELRKLYQILKNNPKLKIRIEGHICCMVNTTDGYDIDAQDFGLSTNRAKHIYDILIEKGIDKNRLEYQGFGRTRPLVDPERTPEDENKNRRVEIRILDK